MSDDKREDEWEVCTPSAERGYGDNHHWRWDRARCEMCGLELDDYVAKSDNARTQLEERVRDLEAVIKKRCRYCALEMPRLHYDRPPIRYGEERPHLWGHQYFKDRWEEFAGYKWEELPSSKKDDHRTFDEVFPDGIWDLCTLTADEIALLSPLESSGTEGEGK